MLLGHDRAEGVFADGRAVGHDHFVEGGTVDLATEGCERVVDRIERFGYALLAVDGRNSSLSAWISKDTGERLDFQRPVIARKHGIIAQYVYRSSG